MANRALEQKRQKMKRMRRSDLKKYSNGYISVGPTPNRMVVDQYRQASRSLAFDAEYMAELEHKTPFKNVPPGRVEAQERAEVLKRLEAKMPERLFIQYLENTYQRVRFYFNSKKTCFICVHEDFKNKMIKTSMEYGSLERVQVAWIKGKTVWVEHHRLPKSSSG